MGKKYKYCLFDLDGTLTDPKEGICKSAQYGLHKMGIEEPDLDKLEPFIGPPLLDSYMEFYNMSKEDAEKAVAFYRERFSVVGLYENELYPGIADMLKELKAKNVKISIASSKPTVFVEKILEHFKIKQYFDAIVGSELDGTRVKKSEVINEALSQLLGVENTGEMLELDDETRKAIVMIGDRRFDIEGAKSFNVDSIGVSYGYGGKSELKRAGATYIASDVATLTSYILSEKKKTDDFVETPLPEQSFFRALYAVVPFALYECIMMAVVSVCKIVFGEMSKSQNPEIIRFLASDSWVFSGGIVGLSTLIAGLMMLVLYHKTDRIRVKGDIGLIPVGLAGMLLAVGLNIFFGFVNMWLPDLAVDTSASIKNVPILVGIVISVIISPISEELLFRYMIYGRVKRFMKPMAAAFITALFFGMYHGNLLQGIYAFIMGFAMALVYEWSKDFLAPLVFHISANAVIFGIMQLPASKDMPVLTVLICIFTVVSGAVLLMKLRKYYIKNT